MRTADHWAIVRAIAYSGHPDWRGLMTRSAPKIPTRKLMAQRYLEGKLPTPDTPPVAEKKTTWKDHANPAKWFARKTRRTRRFRWSSARRCWTSTGATTTPRVTPRRSSA